MGVKDSCLHPGELLPVHVDKIEKLDELLIWIRQIPTILVKDNYGCTCLKSGYTIAREM